MCFSATANFVGSAVLAGIGVATLREVKHRREILFASLPLLFAVHQFTEGWVWLGLDGHLPPIVAHDAGAAFMLYAQGFLPLLIPLGVVLFEQTAQRRRLMLPFAVVGGLLTLYILWALAAFPTQVYIKDNSLVYINPATNDVVVALLYVIVTCGALLLSRVRPMVLFGIANLVILILTFAVKRYAFTSVWCAYAALASTMLWWGFRRSRGERPFHYAEAM